MQHVDKPVPVLDEEAVVEMELLRDVSDLGRRGTDAAGQRDGRVARNERQQEEDAERDDEQYRHEGQQTV